MGLYIFDIDGTITDVSHRQHFLRQEPKDWDSFNAAMAGDAPQNHIIDLIDYLFEMHTIVLLTGRSSDYRGVTEQWLKDHHVKYMELIMRPSGDRTDDAIIKSNAADRLIHDLGRIDMVYEDRDRVVKMWRERGIPCMQVAYGDF